MTDHNKVSPVEHVETRFGITDAMAQLYQQWRACCPRAPRSQFLKLAEEATKPQQQSLLPAVARPMRVPAALGSDLDVWFADFWRTYPRKVGKGDARKAWASAVRRTGDPAVILLGARRYAADPNLPEMQFVPHPATWLRGERWCDGPLAPRILPQPARTTRALVGLAQHTNALPVLPVVGR